jgi:hypothetical protein
MSEAKTTITAPPKRLWFQFTLGTLLLATLLLASSLAVFGVLGIAMFGIAAGVVMLHYRSPWPKSSIAASLLALCVLSYFACVSPTYWHRAEAAARSALCGSFVQNVADALQQYREANGSFPPAYIADTSGKPLYSWRLLLLPYFERDDLHKSYKKFNLAESWDAPNNRNLLDARMPAYWCSIDRMNSQWASPETNFLAVVGENAAWLGDKPRKLADFGNKAADTIMVIEVVDSGIAWPEPKELSLDTLTKRDAMLAPQPGSKHGPQADFFYVYDEANGAYAIMADGTVRYLLRSSLTPEHLPALLQIGGCKEGSMVTGVRTSQWIRHLNWPNIAALAVWLITVAALLARAVRSGASRTPVSTN